MWIKQLNVKNCRLIEKTSIQFAPKINIITGDNASGKTSLLEALNLLSSGRSFRTSHISNVISHNQETVVVSAKVHTRSKSSHIGIEKSSSKTQIRIDKQNVYSQAELSRHLAITIIHPDSIQLITGAPSRRRAYIDWITFYLFSDFYPKWKAYRHILKQRNLCLKNKKHRYALDKWTQELVSLQPDIIKYRAAAIDKLAPLFKETASQLLGNTDIMITLKSGLPDNIELDKESLLAHYQSKIDTDSKLQRTTTGVHRADLKILIDSKPAEESASRGQLKLLSIALLLSQSRAIKSEMQGKGILLFDDFSAELDSYNQKGLLNYLIGLDQQIILTTTQKDIDFPCIENKMFHVEHGEIEEVGSNI